MCREFRATIRSWILRHRQSLFFCTAKVQRFPQICKKSARFFIGHTDLTDPTDFWSADKHDYYIIFTDHRTQASCRAQQSRHYSISHRSNGSHWFFCAGAALAASICEINNNLWKENPWDLWDLCDIIITLCNFIQLDSERKKPCIVSNYFVPLQCRSKERI